MSGLRQNLYHVAVAEAVLELNDASVHLCPDARVADVRVNRVREVDGRGVARQHDDFAREA